MEQRKEIRTTVFAPVDVISGAAAYHELAKDISPGGVYIQSCHSFTVGELLELVFAFPSYPKAISLSGQVIRADAEGIGIEFATGPSGTHRAGGASTFRRPGAWP